MLEGEDMWTDGRGGPHSKASSPCASVSHLKLEGAPEF